MTGTPFDNAEDVRLMALVAKGDDAAFAVLVETYSDILLNFFLRQSVSYEDGQDLVQRTFLRLWRYRAKFRPKAKFTTFLFLLARQEAIDFFRASAARRELAEGLARELESQTVPFAGAADGASPGMADDVRAAVAGLEPAFRDVVELGVFQDLPYAEVAEILSIPKGTVKSRMFHALKKLKEALKR